MRFRLNRAKQGPEPSDATTRSRSVIRTCEQTFYIPEPIGNMQRFASWPLHHSLLATNMATVSKTMFPHTHAGTRGAYYCNLPFVGDMESALHGLYLASVTSARKQNPVVRIGVQLSNMLPHVWRVLGSEIG